MADGVTTARAPARITAKQWLALALLCAAAFGIGALLRQSGPVGTDVSGRIDVDPMLADQTSPSSGPADAPVTIVEFSDYQCSACRKAHPAMLAAAERAGDVRIVYRDLPVFGPISEQAARVALAARNQGLYPQVHDAMMRERRQLTEPVLRGIVESAGGDWSLIERDLAADSEIEAQLALNQADALRLGVSGTPTYLIGPYRIVGALSEDRFLKAFEQAREAQP